MEAGEHHSGSNGAPYGSGGTSSRRVTGAGKRGVAAKPSTVHFDEGSYATASMRRGALLTTLATRILPSLRRWRSPEEVAKATGLTLDVVTSALRVGLSSYPSPVVCWSTRKARTWPRPVKGCVYLAYGMLASVPPPPPAPAPPSRGAPPYGKPKANRRAPTRSRPGRGTRREAGRVKAGRIGDGERESLEAPIGIALVPFGPSARLEAALASAVMREARVLDYARDPPGFLRLLARARGVGNTTLKEARTMMEKLVRDTAERAVGGDGGAREDSKATASGCLDLTVAAFLKLGPIPYGVRRFLRLSAFRDTTVRDVLDDREAFARELATAHGLIGSTVRAAMDAVDAVLASVPGVVEAYAKEASAGTEDAREWNDRDVDRRPDASGRRPVRRQARNGTARVP